MRLARREQEWICHHASLTRAGALYPAGLRLNWERVIRVAIDGGVAPLIHHSLSQLPDEADAPDNVHTRFKQQYELSVANNLRYETTLAQLVSALRSRGVEVVLLKGLSVGRAHYPDPVLRPIRDLDLFIRVRDFPEVRDLMSEWKFEMEYPEEGELPFLRGQKKFFQRSSHRVIQFHWEYVNNVHLRSAVGTGLELTGLWDTLENMEVRGVAVNVLPLERLFPYLCVHLACHHQFKRLLWVCDLHMMLTGARRREIRQQVLPKLIWHPGTRPAVHFSLKMVRSLLGTPDVEEAIGASRPRRVMVRALCSFLRPSDTLIHDGTLTKMRRKLFREGMKKQDKAGRHGKKLRVVLVSINIPRNYNLAIEYLRLYALENAGLRGRAVIRTINVQRRVSRYFILAWILIHRPDVVGFSCYIWNARKTLIVARLVKRYWPRARVVLGGQEVTLSNLDFLREYPFIDVVVEGEGEETFSDLLTRWCGHRNGSLSDVPGILYRTNGRVVRTAERPLIDDLDQIGSPYLSGRIPLRRQYRLGMMLEMCRGCRFRCAFCFEAKKYRRVRSFSVDRLEREVNSLFARGARRFHVMDPILGNCDSETLSALHRIFQRIQSLGRCEISVEVFAELLNERTLKYLQPFTIFDVGLQSIHPPVLRNIHRPYHREKFIKGVGLLKQLNRQVNIYLIMGLPGETPITYLQGVRFAVSLDPSYLFLNQLCVLNGTELRERAEELGLIYERRASYHIIETPDMTSDEIRRLRLFSDALSAEHNLKIGR